MKNIDYSKPLLDINKEFQNVLQEDNIILKAQIKSAKILKLLPHRKNCILCKSKLIKKNEFYHRDVIYVRCNKCFHIQSLADSSKLDQKKILANFSKIYKAESNNLYRSKRDKIYDPKLNWLLSKIPLTKQSKINKKKIKWIEIGCGAGYFLSALKNRNLNNYIGFDVNKNLVSTAKHKCGDKKVKLTNDIYTEIKNSNANIYVSFFVLEHLHDPKLFWDIMSRKPKGTLFYFSVPVLSFSTLLDSLFDSFAARSIDNFLHTQLYSDDSLNYIFKKSGYKVVSQWLFGQDSNDFFRLLNNKREKNFVIKELIEKSRIMLDEFQSIIDKNNLCDARHILIEKK